MGGFNYATPFETNSHIHTTSPTSSGIPMPFGSPDITQLAQTTLSPHVPVCSNSSQQFLSSAQPASTQLQRLQQMQMMAQLQQYSGLSNNYAHNYVNDNSQL